MASCSAKERRNDRDKKVGLEAEVEEERLKIEPETMEK